MSAEEDIRSNAAAGDRDPAAAGIPPDSRLSLPQIRAIRISLLVVLVILSFWGMGYSYLWSDEADTGIYAKQILKTGLPLSFDGRNLYAYRGGTEQDRRLLPVQNAWLQYYVAAASFKVFGITDWSARLPFVLCGIATVWLAYLFARRLYAGERVALLALLLLSTNVQFLLFARQCRYYTLSSMLFMGILLTYSRCLGRVRDAVWSAVLFVLMFLAHPLMFAAAVPALIVGTVPTGERRKALRCVLFPSVLALCVSLVFMTWLWRYLPPHGSGSLFSNLAPSRFLRVFWLYLRDYNFTGAFPIGMVLLYGVTLAARKQGAALGAHWSEAAFRKDAQLAVIAVIGTLVLSILSQQQPGMAYSDLRYAAAFFPVLLILQASIFARIADANRWLAAMALLAVIFSNLLSFGLPRFFLMDYIAENMNPAPTSTRLAVEHLRKNAKQDDTVLVFPNFELASVLYQLSGKLLFCGVLGPRDQNILPYNPKLPEHIYSSSVEPDWIVMFTAFPGFGEEYLTDLMKHIPLKGRYKPIFFPGPGTDVRKPELRRRIFGAVPVADRRLGLTIFQKIGKAK